MNISQDTIIIGGNGEPGAANLPARSETPAGEQVYFGTKGSMKADLAICDAKIPPAQVDRDYNVKIAITKGRTGENDVAEHASRTFTKETASISKRCVDLESYLSADITGNEAKQKSLAKLNAGTQQYKERSENGIPWTGFEKFQVAVLFVISLVLVAVGINTMAQYVIASGIRGTDVSWRAYLFCFIPVAIPVLLELPWLIIKGERFKNAYMASIWGLGLALGIIWIFQFAKTFGGGMAPVQEIIGKIIANSSPAGAAGQSGGSYIAVSILAESFLAAGCWLAIQFLFEKHQSSIRVPSPAFDRTQQDIDQIGRHLIEQIEIRSKIRAKLQEIEEAKQCFINKSLADFRVALAMECRNERLKDLYENPR